jgi:hypothetical protein
MPFALLFFSIFSVLAVLSVFAVQQFQKKQQQGPSGLDHGSSHKSLARRIMEDPALQSPANRAERY